MRDYCRYIGIPFVVGGRDIQGFDCWGFLKHYYKNELNIDVIDYDVTINNSNNKKFINHINGIKTDNRIENLEWVTHKENCIHANKIGLCKANILGVKLSNSKLVLDINTGVYYNSAKEVADLYGFKENVFRNRLNPNNECKNNTQFIFV